MDHALLINCGTLHSTDSMTGRQFFGEIIRESANRLNQARAGQIIVLDTVCQHSSFREWLEKQLDLADYHANAQLARTPDTGEYLIFSRTD
jgi:hypothetical protein